MVWNKILLTIILIFNVHFIQSAIFNRYQPTHGKVVNSSNRGIRIEKLATFGASKQMQRTAVNLIQKYFNPKWLFTGEDSNLIGKMMEKKFGGIFFVGMFSGDTDTAYTVVRRSPMYLLYRVSDRMVLIARESSNPRIHNDSLL